jgi:hypothetical protein
MADVAETSNDTAREAVKKRDLNFMSDPFILLNLRSHHCYQFSIRIKIQFIYAQIKKMVKL